MSNRGWRLLTGVLVIWLVGVGLVYVSMGRPVENSTSVLQKWKQNKEKESPRAVSVATEPSPAAPVAGFASDSLDITKNLIPASGQAPVPDLVPAVSQPDHNADSDSGYSPCPVGRGHGRILNMKGLYDEKGRYVLYLRVDGRIGSYLKRTILNQRPGVTFVDLAGDIKFNQSQYQITPATGAAHRVRLGRHHDFTRVSLTYYQRRSPESVQVEVGCRPGELVIRYTFNAKLAPTEAVAALPPPPNLTRTLGAMEKSQERWAEPVGQVVFFSKGQRNEESKSVAANFNKELSAEVPEVSLWTARLTGQNPQEAAETLETTPAGFSGEDLGVARPDEPTLSVSTDHDSGSTGSDREKSEQAKSEPAESDNLPATEPLGSPPSLPLNDSPAVEPVSPVQKPTEEIPSSESIVAEDAQVPQSHTLPTPVEAILLAASESLVVTEGLGEEPLSEDPLSEEPLSEETSSLSNEDSFLDDEKLATNTLESSKVSDSESIDQESHSLEPESLGVEAPTEVSPLASDPDVKTELTVDGLSPGNQFVLFKPEEGPGQGTFRFLSGHNDALGRYILLLEFEGRLGEFKVNTFHGESLSASYLDFAGNYKFVKEYWPVRDSSVNKFRFGRHPGFTRLSLNYKKGQAPQSAQAQIYRHGSTLAVVFEFSGGQTAELIQRRARKVAEKNPLPTFNSGVVGQGQFGRLKGRYDQEGRYVLGIELKGRVGEYSYNTDTTQVVVATYIDFKGDYPFSQALYPVHGGPILYFRLGAHQGFTRLSLTYRDNQAPDNTEVKLEERDGRVFLTFVFDGGIAKERAIAAFKAGL